MQATESQKLSLAMSKNPPGVRFAESGPDNHKALMGHYLGFANTEAFKALMISKDSTTDAFTYIVEEFGSI